MKESEFMADLISPFAVRAISSMIANDRPGASIERAFEMNVGAIALNEICRQFGHEVISDDKRVRTLIESDFFQSSSPRGSVSVMIRISGYLFRGELRYRFREPLNAILADEKSEEKVLGRSSTKTILRLVVSDTEVDSPKSRAEYLSETDRN